ncbi:MAG: hypothetical protein IPN68_02600 [Bacteroidetes bacterium]|nr:hypothetical protein [Bacteroidota bacterium]
MVNFGTDETGLGDLEPSPVVDQAEAIPPPPSNESIKAEEEPLLTQNMRKPLKLKKLILRLLKRKKNLRKLKELKGKHLRLKEG